MILFQFIIGSVVVFFCKLPDFCGHLKNVAFPIALFRERAFFRQSDFGSRGEIHGRYLKMGARASFPSIACLQVLCYFSILALNFHRFLSTIMRACSGKKNPVNGFCMGFGPRRKFFSLSIKAIYLPAHLR